MRRKVKKRNNSLIYLAIIGIIIVVFFGYQSNLSANVEVPSTPSVEPNRQIWHFAKSPFRREIITTQDADITFELNHAEMVIDQKSLSSGYDLNVLAQENETYTQIEFKISKLDTVKTLINFSKIEGYESYFLYYGDTMQTKDNLKTFNETKITNGTLKDEEVPRVTISLDKKWILKENSIKTIEISILKNNLVDDINFYAIVNDKITPILVQPNKELKFLIDVANLKIGLNSIYIYSNSGNQSLRSNTLNFIYTAPIYVGWTVDWEGTAPDQKYLDSIENLANGYNLPITHYYNPRLYILLKTTDQRRKEITDWIVQRIKIGDDLALHMHMQHDLVEEAGVKAKYNEKAWDNGVSGYDTPTTAYSYDEIKKIIAWGKKTLENKFMQFSNFKLPELQGYRAGGWFANLDTLRAIEDNGLIYDSSGRNSFEIGKNKFTQSWKLQNTSQPYLPSRSDQNVTGTNNFKLIEIPNNGLDSYWSSSQEMISSFYANFNPGEFIASDKLIVYLSHPDWFNIDEPKLKEVFNEIGKYRNDKDLGPVKFVTMREYLAQSDYINSLTR